MTERQLFQAIGSVDGELVEAADKVRSRPVRKLTAARLGLVAACVALIAGLGIFRWTSSQSQLVPQVPIGRTDGAAPFSAAIGVRKFFNYNGYRYAFANDGTPYDFSGFDLTEKLGVLEYDIMAGIEGLGDTDYTEAEFSTTFALGGELYAIPGYDPAFRIAVVYGDDIYLAELVGRTDNVELDLDYYFRVSRLEELTEEILIQDHMGIKALSQIEKKDAREMIRILSGASVTELTVENYEAVARAQNEGKSYQLGIQLTDGTEIGMYVLPELGYVSIGDSTYLLPEEFLETYGEWFESLEQGTLPMY